MNIVGKELIKLANKSELIKKCLGIPKDFKNICYIGHNTVHQDLGNGQKRGLFYGKRKYKNYLTTNMLMNLEREGVFKSLEKKFGQEVVEEYMNEHLLVGALVKYGSGSFNPDANPESTSVDGYVERAATDVTWTDIREGAGTSSNDITNDALAIKIYAGTNSGDWRGINRGIFLFDISSIGTGDIDSGDMKLHGIYTNHDDFSKGVDIVSSNPASNTALANSDYDYNDFGTTRFATTKTIASLSTSAYNTWGLNGDGTDFIQTALDDDGIVKLACRHESDVDGVAPTWGSFNYDQVSFIMADNGSNEPELDVTWSVSATSTGFFNMF